MVTEYALTTIDNPYNPFTEPDDWQKFDDEHGYNTNEFLALFAFESETLGEELKAFDVQAAIQMALDEDDIGIRIKVTKDTKLRPVPVEKLIKDLNEYEK